MKMKMIYIGTDDALGCDEFQIQFKLKDLNTLLREREIFQCKLTENYFVCKANIGNDVSVTCKSDAIPSSDITWKKDGEAVPDITDGILSLSKVKTRPHLKVTSGCVQSPSGCVQSTSGYVQWDRT